MRAISLILSVAGTLVLFVVPIRLSIADSIKADLGQRIPQLAKWLVIWNAFNYFGCIATIVGLKRFPPLERLNWLGGFREMEY
jgi:hypothetical protein